MKTNNKIALVTGGSRGLGRDMALNLAKKGFDVIFTYNNKKDDALAVIKEIEKSGSKAETLQFDTGDIKNFPAFIDALKAILRSSFNTERFDFLINNAGIGIHAPFTETSEDQFDQLMNIHFKGVFFLTQKSLSLINDGGRIINISTGLARFSTPGYSAYASMKGAIETLTKYQAQELGARRINVNVVAPGAIETDFGGGGVRDNEQLNKYIASVTALGRVGRAEDIGSIVAFLCTDDARWITGQRIEASGGMYI